MPYPTAQKARAYAAKALSVFAAALADAKDRCDKLRAARRKLRRR